MTRTVPLDAFYDLTELTDLALSPDGERVAFVTAESAPEDDERIASLYVAPTDGSRDPHRLTRLPGAADPAWGPGGDRLAFLAARETDVDRRVGREADDGGDGSGNGEDGDETGGDERSGDEEPKRQVWLFDLAWGGDARQVTDFDEGARSFDWSPGGDRLVVAARDPTDDEADYLADRREGGPIETERLQHKLDGVGYLDAVTTYLFVVDAETGEGERLDDAHGGGAFEGIAGMEPAWGPGDRIAFTSCRTERPDATMVRDCYTIAPDGGDLRKLTGSDLTVAHPTWDADGDRLAFTGRDPENWCIPTQVYVHDLGGDHWRGDDRRDDQGRDDGDRRTDQGRTGDGDEGPSDASTGDHVGRYESITADLDRTLARNATVEWDGDDVYTLVGDEGRTRLIRARADGRPADRTFEAQGEGRALERFVLASGGARAALVFSHPGDGQDAFAVDAADLDADAPPASLTRLSAVNADLIDDYPTPECDRVAWESDGERIEGLCYHAPDVDPDDGPHPLVVAIHGGPVSYDEPEFRFDHAVFTSRGYLVLRPNYRGGTSYGRAFSEALRGQWGTVETDDIAAGIEYAIDEGWADPDRVFGYGFSYGGIAQGYLVTQTDLLAAAAPEHGIYDLRSAFGTDDSQNWTVDEYGVPWENRAAIESSSSITDVGALDTPLLVMAGGEDWRCAPSQSEQLYVSARRQGVDAKLVVYPDEHHDIGDPDRAIHRLETILDWYERHDPTVEDDQPV